MLHSQDPQLGSKLLPEAHSAVSELTAAARLSPELRPLRKTAAVTRRGKPCLNYRSIWL